MPRLARTLFRTAALMALAAAARAAPPVDAEALRAWLDPQVAATAAREGFSRYEIEVGTPRMPPVLAACARSEFFMPAGARPWGRGSVGLRCVEGARWTLLVPVTVAVWGSAVVTTHPLPAGTVLAADQLELQDVELTREPPGAARELEDLAGRTLTRAVAAGQPVRPDMTRATPVVQAGDAVRLRIIGNGFSIAAAGQAMNNAGTGQSVRVRTEMGKILNGVAREGRIIDVRL